jgi:hypothetical protein
VHLGLLWCAISQPTGCATTFWEHFAKVLGGGGDISLSIQNLLDTLVYEVESSLSVEGAVYDEPSLQEVAKCIDALHNVTTPGVDRITAPLLKAGLEPIAWLHKAHLDCLVQW